MRDLSCLNISLYSILHSFSSLHQSFQPYYRFNHHLSKTCKNINPQKTQVSPRESLKLWIFPLASSDPYERDQNADLSPYGEESVHASLVDLEHVQTQEEELKTCENHPEICGVVDRGDSYEDSYQDSDEEKVREVDGLSESVSGEAFSESA